MNFLLFFYNSFLFYFEITSEKEKFSGEFMKKQAMRQSGRGRSRPDDKKQRGPRDEVPASVGVYHITGCERENQPVIMEREFN